MLGCTGWGPRSVVIDRGNYIDAIASSSKEQIFNNLLRFRYGDVTAFVDLKQIVSGYTYGGSIGVNVLPDRINESAEVGGSLRYEGRPTLTYVPLTGRDFYANILTPIPPEAIFSVLRAGWPVDLVLGTTVQKINGISAGISIGRHKRPPDPRFWKIVELIEMLYADGILDFRISREQRADKDENGQGQVVNSDTGKSLMWLEETTANAAARNEIDDLKRLLGLDPDISEFELIFGRLPGRADQIVIMTHSIMTILGSFADKAGIPQGHIADGLAPASTPVDEMSHGLPFTIAWGSQAPAYAYVKTRYQDLWFWIANEDFPTKRTFSFLALLFSLSAQGEGAQPPLLTIPAN